MYSNNDILIQSLKISIVFMLIVRFHHLIKFQEILRKTNLVLLENEVFEQ